MLKTAATAKIRMVEPLTELAHLDDHIKLVVSKLLHHPLIGGAVFAGMDVIGALAAAAVGFDDLPAMLKVQRGRDDLELLSPVRGPEFFKLPDGGVNDGVQGFGRGDDTAPEIRILLPKLADLIKGHFDFLSVLAPDIAERAGIKNDGLEALYITLLDGAEYRIGVE